MQNNSFDPWFNVSLVYFKQEKVDFIAQSIFFLNFTNF